VIRRLGEGGFGIVFLAHQEEPIRRDVAVKVVRAGVGGSKVLARFEAERQTLALMNHPGLAKVIDAGRTEAGESYFVMEYVEGKPIDEVCDELKLSLRERVELMISICEAIQHAHGKGIIHRDLKPGNILVSLEGDRLLPHVIDFGIAKALDPDLIGTRGVTVEGQFIGTPNYMSPEHIHDAKWADQRSDVYSLGATMYHLLTGQPAFPETDLVAKVSSIQNETPPSPKELRPDVPDALCRVIARMMAKKPDDRYQTPKEVVNDLKTIRNLLSRQPVEHPVTKSSS
jgi:serine/threonine protein kinase